MKRGILTALAALASAALCVAIPSARPAYGQGAQEGEVRGEVLAPLARLEREKVETTGPGRLMDALGVRPGMNILDVGAGTGQWSYAFARRLRGRGAVYATEVDPLKVSFIEEEARGKGLETVHPVLVVPEGVDPFYSRHRYDVIFLSHVYYYVKDTPGYFAAMGNSLADGGTLVIIVVRHRPYLALDDIRDFEGLLNALSRDPANNPFLRNLEDSTRALIGEHSAGKPAEALRVAVVRDLNAMLRMPRFHEEFSLERLSFTEEEKAHYQWLLGFVRENITYDGRQLPFESGEEHLLTQYGRLIRFLNHMVIHQYFRDFLAEGSLRASRLDKVVTHRLEEEGYLLKESLDLHPFNYILVFARK